MMALSVRPLARWPTPIAGVLLAVGLLFALETEAASGGVRTDAGAVDWYVVLATYRDVDGANARSQDLSRQLTQRPVVVRDADVWRVVSGPFAYRQTAERARDALRRVIPDAWIHQLSANANVMARAPAPTPPPAASYPPASSYQPRTTAPPSAVDRYTDVESDREAQRRLDERVPQYSYNQNQDNQRGYTPPARPGEYADLQAQPSQEPEQPRRYAPPPGYYERGPGATARQPQYDEYRQQPQQQRQSWERERPQYGSSDPYRDGYDRRPPPVRERPQGWFVIVSSHTDANQANRRLQELTSTFPTLSVLRQNALWRVVSGPHRSEEAALEIRTRVRRQIPTAWLIQLEY